MPELRDFQILWAALKLPVPGGGEPTAVFDALRTRYSEPHRRFHNFAHIEFCLGLLIESWSLSREPYLVGAAIWFHDAVYDTHAHDNEEQSATLAGKLLPLPPVAAATVHRLILDTKHVARPDTIDGEVLADIDLAGIGGTSAAFAEGCAQIRQEYGWVPAEIYKINRGKFLQSLIARPEIYYTPEFHAKYEVSARRNLQEELDRLRAM